MVWKATMFEFAWTEKMSKPTCGVFNPQISCVETAGLNFPHGDHSVSVWSSSETRIGVSVLALAAGPSGFCLFWDVIAPPATLEKRTVTRVFPRIPIPMLTRNRRKRHTSVERPVPFWPSGWSCEMNASFSQLEISVKSAQESSPLLLRRAWLALILNELHLFNKCFCTFHILQFPLPADVGMIPFCSKSHLVGCKLLLLSDRYEPWGD